MNKLAKLITIISMSGLLWILSAETAQAGKVVVRKASEPFDAFAIRDQVQQEHQWQEMLRMQQQIQILQALPVGCLPIAVPYHYFNCSGNAYRPYPYQGKEVFIQIDQPKNTSNHHSTNKPN
ncbi:hypothetical protein [Shewanella sp. KT0246]|uniref:hypothetical protein n=1 Tax=Shewanella sp. KT0246 TaxID=2815912 RepID=UPI001BC41CB2|nr:hypothetical protein [Shewanella sp. KT0246]GIU51422.1 hypothetical protein TUM4249_16230 [Shewanella sp. KT0246]